MKAIVLEMYHRMAQLFLQVADDQESHTELVAGGDEVAVQLGELGELEHDHLGHSVFLDRTAEAVRPAENRNLALRPIEGFIANDADRAQSHLALAPQPTAQPGGLCC